MIIKLIKLYFKAILETPRNIEYVMKKNEEKIKKEEQKEEKEKWKEIPKKDKKTKRTK